MNEPFESADEVVAFPYLYAAPGYGAQPGSPIAARSIEVFTESNRKRLACSSNLGTSLAQITSRLLDQLATGAVSAQHGGLASAGDSQRDARITRVPRDDSPLVSWTRVIAVSAAGSLLALASLPVQDGSARMAVTVASA